MIFAAATNNAKKLKEIKRILNALGHDAKTLRELGIEIEIERLMEGRGRNVPPVIRDFECCQLIRQIERINQ